MTESKPSVLIIGTGAMACLFAARLSAAGTTVTMLGTWSEALEALSKHGVRLTDANGVTSQYPVKVAHTLSSVTDSDSDCTPAKYALVLVKSWQTPRAAQQLRQCLSQNGLVLTLQNGLGNLEVLEAVLGPERVTLGVTTVGASLLSPGVVIPGGTGKISVNGHPRLGPLTEMLSQAGFLIEHVDRADSLLWGKLVINAAINPITALLNVTNGEILERKSARRVMGAAATEAYRVAIAKGIPLLYDDPVAAAESVAFQTASNRSSMLQDVQRGAPTEIDAICGAITREGVIINSPTPVNWTLLNLIQARVNITDDVGVDGVRPETIKS